MGARFLNAAGPALLAAVLAPSPTAATEPSVTVTPSPLGPVHHAALANGLTVLVLPDRSSPLVSVAVMYSVGARNEAAGTTGLAHYVEHMNFRATRRFPGSEATECITRIGGRWNGYTWIDQTHYAETVPREALDLMLDLEADRMTAALHDPAEFARERSSVLAELRSYDDPQSVLYDAVLASSFEIHPYRNNTIGWPIDVLGVTRDEAYGFYRRFYRPRNAVLVVVGDMDPAATLAKVRERFEAIPAGGEPTDVRTVEPVQTGQRRVAVRRPGPHARILVAYRAPALTDADFPALVLLDALLAGGKGFRFTRDYPAPARTPLSGAVSSLATEAATDWQASRYPYVYTLTAAAPEATALPGLEAALFRAVADAAVRRWTAEEIQAALRQVRAGWAADLEDQAGRAHQLAFFEVSGGFGHLLDMPERLARVTADDLARLAAERLQPHQATVGWFLPTPPEAAAATPAPRGGEPAAATREPTRPPPLALGTGPVPATLPRRDVLPHGLTLVLAPLSSSMLVTVRGRIDAGGLHDTAPGLSALAVELLAQPAPGERTDTPGLAWTLHADPAAAASRRFIEFAGSGMPEDLPVLAEVLAGRLARSAAPVAVESLGDLARAAAQRARERDATGETALLREALVRLYPKGSPAAVPPWGSPSALEAVTAGALELFLRRHVTPSRTTMVVTGTFDPAIARPVLEAALGRIPSGIATAPAQWPVAAGPARFAEARFAASGKAQSDILVVWPGDRSRLWDPAATRALLYLLGETGYAGRLGRSLVEPGLVYSVNASLEEDGAPGFLQIRTAAASQDVAEAMRRIRSILEDAARGPFSQADLDEAKTYLRGKAARERDGAVAAAETLLREALAPATLPADALTLAQLNDTASRLFRNGAPLALIRGPED
ncbi:MAG: insulinase family protein [Acidobacteria bacterium]|nr:insulinase family protein [Acidobacteriota bacterium]